MSFFRFQWLRRFVRRNTSPIPEDNAYLWKKRLSLTYAFLAWNAFGFVCYNIYRGNADWARDLKSPEELATTPGQHWAKVMGKKNATIYRIDGFHVEKIEVLKENNTTEESK